MRSNGPSPGPNLSLGSSYVPLVLHDGIYKTASCQRYFEPQSFRGAVAVDKAER
jgi:hypothetical protein